MITIIKNKYAYSVKEIVYVSFIKSIKFNIRNQLKILSYDKGLLKNMNLMVIPN